MATAVAPAPASVSPIVGDREWTRISSPNWPRGAYARASPCPTQDRPEEQRRLPVLQAEREGRPLCLRAPAYARDPVRRAMGSALGAFAEEIKGFIKDHHTGPQAAKLDGSGQSCPTPSDRSAGEWAALIGAVYPLV